MGGRPVDEVHVHDLVVDRVVAGVEHAARDRMFFLVKDLDDVFAIEGGGAPDGPILHRDRVDAISVIDAFGLEGGVAILAMGRAALGGFLGAVVVEAAEGRDRVAFLAHEPAEDVEVVAAFRDDGRAAFLHVAPWSAHIAKAEMPEGDVLGLVDRDDVPKLAFVDHGLDRAVEGGITQNVGEHDLAPEAVGFVADRKAIFFRDGRGFFKA